VGSRLPPNPLGVYDMADNGMEWVSDWYSDTWDRNNQNMTNPTGPVDGTEKTLRNLDFSFSRIGMPETVPTLHSADRLHRGEFSSPCALCRPSLLNTPGGKQAELSFPATNARPKLTLSHRTHGGPTALDKDGIRFS